MNCKYVIGGKLRDCFYGPYSGMSVYGDDHMTEIGNYEMQQDVNGKRYFEVDGQRIMFAEDLVCDTPQEFIDNIKNRHGDHLCCVLLKHGIDCLTVKCRVKKMDRINVGGFSIGIVSTTSNERIEDWDWVDYKFIDTEFNRKPEDCYKLDLIPKNEEDKHAYPNEGTYVSDLVSLIAWRTDLYQIYVSDEYKEREAAANV